MQKQIVLFKLLLCLLFIAMIKTNSYAQTGLNFQGVARTSNNVIIASQQISLRLSILQGSATGNVEYSETRKVTTNAQGLFAVVIGDADATSTMGSFNTINWKNTPKYLKIEMDANAGNNYTTIGTTQFQYVAYAQFASSVDAENIVGVVPVARGGTGATNLTSFKSSLVLDKINNTSDADKPISTKTQTALDLKLNAADTSKYTKQSYTDAALLTKFNLADTGKYTKQVYTDSSLITKLKLSDTASMLSNRIGKDTLNLSARINAKANTSDVNTVLALKANTSDVTTSLLSKLNKTDTSYLLQKADTATLSNRINLKANTSDVNTSLGLKANASEVTTSLLSKLNKTDTATLSNRINLKANISDVNTSLALKANTSDVTTSLSSKVDKISGKELSTNDYSNAEKVKLAAITGTNTGDQDLSSYATNTALALKANTADVNTSLGLKANSSDLTTSLSSKVDKVTGRELSTNDYSNAEKAKLAAITGTNTGDQDLSSYATNTALALKANASDVNTSLGLKANASDVTTSLLSKLNKTDTSYLLQKADTATLSNRINLKANASDVNTSLSLKANASDVTTSLSNKVDKVTGKELSTNDYSNAEKAKLAAITGTNTGDQDLSSYATNTALALKANTADVNTALALKANASDVTTSLALKENTSNKSSASDLGGTSPSDILYPTQKAVKDYVTANASSGGVADGGITTIKLADGAVTDAKLASGISKSKVGLGSVENTALSTWAGSNNLTTVGTITSGIWSGTAIALSNGGTGATNAAQARANLGLVIGTDVQAPLVAGTDYIVPNSSITAKTKIKITYDTKGLITAGSDATTADIAPSTDRNYVTDVQSGVISNTSGINTGDETTSSIKSKLGITTLSGSNTGDQTNVTGNAGTASKLATARKINNVDFDGSGDIIITAIADAGTLTGTTLNPTITESSLTTVGTINSGTWSGTAIALSNGGTGATNATAARANLGLVIGANVQAPLVAGTDYQIPLIAGTNYIVPNSSIAGATKTKITYDTKGIITAGADATTADITPSTDRNYVTDVQSGVISNTSGVNTGDETTSSIKSKLGITTLSGSNTGDQTNITGNAATATTATTAGNITATSNTTLTSLSNLNTVGTITSGVWSGTTVAVEKGGTGLTSAGTAGQVLTSTGRGTLVWQSTTTALSIGDVYQGGIVAYILQAGDPGYDATIQKGLIAATSDQSTGIRWHNGSYTTTGATGTAIGTGLSNTNAIIASQMETATSYAAGLARAYAGGGYTDWYLPSKDELNKLYLNKTAIGGFANNTYWSSTENGNNFAWFQYFNVGDLSSTTKANPFSVRAIRAFSAVKSIEDGGTGATTASAARTNLGLEIGTNVQAKLVAGTGININNNTNSISTIQDISITSNPKLRSLSLTNGDNTFLANNFNQIIFGWNRNTGQNNDGTIEYAHAIKTRHNSLSSLGNNIDFFTWDPDNNYSSTAIGNKHIMTIQGDGKVGIGTLYPLYSLDVVGDIKTTGNLIAGTVTYPNVHNSTAGQLLSIDGSGTATWATLDAGTLSGTTLKSTITGSSLTSVGTLANLTVTNPIVGSITGNAATATSANSVTTNANLTGPVTSVGNTTSIANGAITNAMLANLAVANLSGTNTGDQTTVSGNAGTATKLATARNINDVPFDGTSNIIVTADAGTLSGTTLKSTITGSSLTTVGTITSGVWSATTVAVNKGGTGLTSTGTNGQVLTSTGSGTLTWTTPVFLPTIVIGTQQWMRENLDVMTYRNGDVIPQVTDATAWAGLTTGAWCYYYNDPLNGAIYGKLYNWYAVNDPRGLAPQGWHIPTDAEWTTLGTLLGVTDGLGYNWVDAGGKMKTPGITRWTTPNTSATNESGFAGLPGGYRYAHGPFNKVSEFGFWWSATETSADRASVRNISYNNSTLWNFFLEKKYGYSVRCLRD